MAEMLIQPQGYALVRRDHPDLDGAVDVWLPGVSSRGLLNGMESSSVATGAVQATQQGIGFKTSGVGRRYSPAMLVSSQAAWLVVAHRAGNAVNCSIIRKDGNVTPMQEWDGVVRGAVFQPGGGFEGSVNYGNVASFANRVSTFCGVVSAAETVLFSNGGANISAGARAVTGGNTTNPFCIGAAEGGGEVASNWTVLLVIAWQGRVPTSARLRELSASPWQFFDDPDGESVELDAAGFYTLTADGGQFSTTGAAAVLTAGRRLSASVAGYALTMGAAAVLAARRVSAVPASIAMAGNTAVMRAGRKLPTSPGTVLLSPAAGKLVTGRKLNAQPASLALTGATATFVYTSAPGGQGPTYTLTGGSGMFLLSPLAARLLLARRMVATVGAFSAAGSSAQLAVARRLPTASGTLAVGGAVAGMRAARRLPATAASFALTGTTATFFYTPVSKPGGPTYTLAAVGGALGLTGTGIGMRARRRVAGTAAQFALTGWAANLVYGQQIVYARAPAGSGYTPRTTETQHRPTSAATARPAATQRNTR
jgi:hypothetical protein